MLFNSYEFIFVFLPIVLAGYFALGHRDRPVAAVGWLAAASLLFYAWWDVRYLGLLLGSIAFNYIVGRMLCAARRGRHALLALGIAGNLLLLGYYKYANFFLAAAGAFAGGHYTLGAIVLPLGISFFTFTQIAYLVDAYREEVHEYRFLHYLLFVTFFPHLIAGPVLHHAEIMPQFRLTRTFRASAENFSVGLTIFIVGLFKKVVLADGVAQYVAPVFSAADAGVAVGGVSAWCAALAYTFQLYFDFSGYSDMAIGLARLFGITFPANFNSPYKAASIIEFWRRWHMTLSRFLRDYLYIALGGSRCSATRRYANLMITMVLGGLWHGAGWTFVAWGALHGAFLWLNHAWRTLYRRLAPASRPSRLGRWAGRLLTFLAVVVAWVFFRAGSIDAALRMLAAMAGANGFAKTDPLYFGAMEAKWLLTLWVIAWALPNAQQLMLAHRGALETYVGEIEPLRRKWLAWSPCAAWSAGTAALAVAATLDLTRIREFLYFQF